VGERLLRRVNMRGSGRIVARLTASLTLFALVACSPSVSAAPVRAVSANPAGVPGAPAWSSPAGINGPLRAVAQAGTDWVTAETAFLQRSQPIVNACMRAKGYDFTAPAPDRTLIRRDGLTSAYGTPLADTTFRRTEGYGVTGALVGTRSVGEPPGPTDAITRGMTDPERNAVMKSYDECARKGASVLQSSTVDEFIKKSGALQVRVDTDPRILRARDQWVSCMKAAGFSYRTTDEPAQAVEVQARPLYESARDGVVTAEAKRLHSEELKMAATDWACREKTITPAFFTVRDEVENAFIEQNPELVGRVRDEMKKIISQ
jgi:hypothetical protein